MANQVKSRKPKTHKGTLKRTKQTKNGKKGSKILLSKSSKNHFNSKNKPGARRSKKILTEATGKILKGVKKALKIT